MIEVEEQTNSDKSKRILQFYLIDGHHHIGEDTDNHKNLTVNGSFDFFRSIWNSLNSKYEEQTNNSSFPEYFNSRFKIKSIFPCPPLNFLKSDPLHANSWLFDQFIAFPFHDKFREKPREDGKIVQYHNSNTRLARIISSNESGCRLIGYCRLNPLDEKLAIEELDYCILKLGLSGIKLHPISDEWNERDYFEENSFWVKEIIKRAVKYNVPVIFDCRFVSTLKWIHNIVLELEEEFIQNRFERSYINKNLKIIVAHIGFLWQSEDILFTALSHPCIYGDLTGLFSSKTRDLTDSLQKKVKCPFNDWTPLEQKYYWSTKVFMGSDFNYFEAFHIVDQLLYFFSEDFYNKIDGNVSVIQNLLSDTILKLLPNDFHPNSTPTSQVKNVTSLIFNLELYNKIISTIFSLVKNYESSQNPIFFRIDKDLDHFRQSLDSGSFYAKNFTLQKQNLNSQYNFYFKWSNNPIIVSGTIPNMMNRFIIYLFSRNDLPKLSFELLKNSATQIPINFNNEEDSSTEAITNKLKIIIENLNNKKYSDR
jgi:predicted TIM-barrel fold metal-dependent hydrolase